MKRIYLFLLACTFALSPTFVQAQNTQDVQDEKKRVVIVKKFMDKDGEVVIEKIIGEGDQADKVLKEMAFKDGDQDVTVTVIKNAETEGSDDKAERLFIIRSSGGEKVEGLLQDKDHDLHIITEDNLHIESLNDEKGDQNVFIIKKGGEEAPFDFEFEFDEDVEMPGDVEEKMFILKERLHKLKGLNDEKSFIWHGGEFKFAGESKANCAALGVYVNSSHKTKGVHINSLIGGGGAEESGLQEGDYLIAIEDEYVNSYQDLLNVLSRYVPGEDVNVTYQRDEQQGNLVVTLKAWRQMPTMANTWRANITCEEKPDELLEIIEATETEVPQTEPSPTFNNTLDLESFSVFPNPSEGKIRLRFNTTADPLSVRVTDLTGKVVYRDNLTKFDGIYNDQINLKKYGPGSYILTIEQNNKVFGEQIIVQ